MKGLLLLLAAVALCAAVVPISEEIDHGDEYAEFRDLETVELDRMDHRGEWETRDDEEAVDVTKAGKKPWWTKKAKSATTTKKQVWATKKPFRGWQGGLKLRRRWNLRSRSRFSYLSTEARRLRRLRRQRERFGL